MELILCSHKMMHCRQLGTAYRTDCHLLIVSTVLLLSTKYLEHSRYVMSAATNKTSSTSGFYPHTSWSRGTVF